MLNYIIYFKCYTHVCLHCIYVIIAIIELHCSKYANEWPHLILTTYLSPLYRWGNWGTEKFSNFHQMRFKHWHSDSWTAINMYRERKLEGSTVLKVITLQRERKRRISKFSYIFLYCLNLLQNVFIIYLHIFIFIF